jgi:hypothetical protein
MVSASQAILEDDLPHLLDLVRFGPIPFGLEVEDLFYSVPGEDAVASPGTLMEPQGAEKAAHPLKGDILV